jgi:hypothetical protein
LSSSGIKAVMAGTLANILAAYLITQSFVAYATFLRKTGVDAYAGEFSPDVQTSPPDEWWLDAHYSPFLISVFGLVALAMICAMRNHRSAERGRRRGLRQILAFAAYQAIVMLSVFIFWNWYSWLH